MILQGIIAAANSGEVAGWTPAEISTALWLDADAADTLILASGKVTEWQDRSGNGRHFTQGNDAQRPLFEDLDGLPAVCFYPSTNSSTSYTGTISLSLAVNLLSAYAYHAFIVCGGSLTENANGYLLSGTTGGTSYASMRQSALHHRNTTDRMLTYSPAPDWTDRARNILQGSWNSSTSRTARINGDGAGSDTSSSNALGTSGTTFLGLQRVPSGSTAAQTWRGSVQELILIYGSLTSDIRDKIEGYLAHKWDLAAKLPVGHPYKVVAP